MKQTLIFLSFCIFFCNGLIAQVENDSVLLKNGDLFIGKCLKYLPNEIIKIKTETEVYMFPISDVKYYAIHSVQNHIEGFEIVNNTKENIILQNQDSIKNEIFRNQEINSKIENVLSNKYFLLRTTFLDFRSLNSYSVPPFYDLSISLLWQKENKMAYGVGLTMDILSTLLENDLIVGAFYNYQGFKYNTTKNPVYFSFEAGTGVVLFCDNLTAPLYFFMYPGLEKNFTLNNKLKLNLGTNLKIGASPEMSVYRLSLCFHVGILL